VLNTVVRRLFDFRVDTPVTEHFRAQEGKVSWSWSRKRTCAPSLGALIPTKIAAFGREMRKICVLKRRQLHLLRKILGKHIASL